MDKKSKVLITIFIIIILVAIGFTFERTIIKKDFYTEQSEGSESTENIDQEEVETY
jgi:hypothetical protein